MAFTCASFGSCALSSVVKNSILRKASPCVLLTNVLISFHIVSENHVLLSIVKSAHTIGLVWLII